MWQYVIYKNPRDYRNNYVVRRWLITQDGMMIPDVKPLAITANLTQARNAIPQQGLVMISRFQQDDPVIVEVWL
jgi:hypothetical protein